MYTIVASENMRVSGRDIVAQEVIARVDSDIPLATLVMMLRLGQARRVVVDSPSGEPEQSQPGTQAATQPGSSQASGPGDADQSAQLTDLSAVEAFGVAEKLVDFLAANDPPIRTKADVIKYLASSKDLTPVAGIGKTSSDKVLSALGLAN
jgi:hypothetical protein